MPSARLNIRIPDEIRLRLEERARMSGFTSGCALARSVLAAFVRYTPAAQGGDDLTGWIESMADADRDDPTERGNINRRL